MAEGVSHPGKQAVACRSDGDCSLHDSGEEADENYFKCLANSGPCYFLLRVRYTYAVASKNCKKTLINVPYLYSRVNPVREINEK